MNEAEAKDLALSYVNSKYNVVLPIFRVLGLMQPELLNITSTMLEKHSEEPSDGNTPGRVLQILKDGPVNNLWWIVVFSMPPIKPAPDFPNTLQLMISDSSGVIHEFSN
jgi:hypothetical protein